MSKEQTEKQEPYTSPFEAIRKETEEGIEYWTARDLAKVLDYDNYRNFLKVVEKAKIACETSGQAVSDHMVEADDMIETGKGALRKIKNMHLSRLEDLPTPKESIQQIQQKEHKRIEQQKQPSLFDDTENNQK